MKSLLKVLLIPLLTATFAPALHAQAPGGQVLDTARVQSHSVVRMVKWSALALSAGAAAYGFVTNGSADEQYEDLERYCTANPEPCNRRVGDAYADPAIERRYRDVVALDDRAATALLASQIGIAAAVVLFIYDLRDARPPRDIPYEPRSLRIAPDMDGGMELRVTVPARF